MMPVACFSATNLALVCKLIRHWFIQVSCDQDAACLLVALSYECVWQFSIKYVMY